MRYHPPPLTNPRPSKQGIVAVSHSNHAYAGAKPDAFRRLESLTLSAAPRFCAAVALLPLRASVVAGFPRRLGVCAGPGFLWTIDVRCLNETNTTP